MKKKLLMVIVVLIALTGCQDLKFFIKDFEQSWKGLNMVVQTYDVQSQVIDKIEGRGVSIKRDKKFDSEDDTIDSQVLNITVGRNEMHHVGSSLIAHETGLINYFEDFDQRVNIMNMKRSTPFVNRFVNEYKNKFGGKSKVILIRSQQGYPLATFIGDNVSLYKTDVPKSTGIIIDGKYLFIYRADYTIYDAKLFMD